MLNIQLSAWLIPCFSLLGLSITDSWAMSDSTPKPFSAWKSTRSASPALFSTPPLRNESTQAQILEQPAHTKPNWDYTPERFLPDALQAELETLH